MSVPLLAFILAFQWPCITAEWRNAGVYSAFLISLFVELFGLLLTIYMLAPLLDMPAWAFGLNESHLGSYLLAWYDLVPLPQAVHLVMSVSMAMITVGVAVPAGGWLQIFRGLRTRDDRPLPDRVSFPVTRTDADRDRFQRPGPTVLTVAVAAAFGEVFHRHRYTARVPAFIPRLRPLVGAVSPAMERANCAEAQIMATVAP